MLPAGTDGGPKVAFRLGAVSAMPRQFGPISRPPWARTSASRRSSSRAPSAPVSAKPAEMTTSARTPLSSACSAASATCPAGTAITARSTVPGKAEVDPIEVARGRLDGQRHLGDPALVLPRQLEARLLEHAQHRPVAGQHFGEEAAYAGFARLLGELLQQTRADPLALELVGDRERHLGASGIAQPEVVAERDDPLVALGSDRARERPALEPVRVERGLDQLRPDVNMAVEARVPALVRELREEREQPVRVVAPRRPQPHRRAVPQNDVTCRRDHRPDAN